MPRLLCILLLSILSVHAFAGPGRADYDLNNNGLIEINSLEDLNAIRFSLDGATLYGENTGCPESGCVGFELTTDLDFDTNGDGVLDENDTYWNEGEGWEPIGRSFEPFTGIFEGNGYVIRNLMINRPSNGYQGLFARTEGAEIRNLGLAGRLMSIDGSSYVGALAGNFVDGSITGSYATGAIKTHRSLWSYTGGLVGSLENSSITASFTAGSVFSNGYYVGGLVGYSNAGSFDAVFSTALVEGDSDVGGLIGRVRGEPLVQRSFATGFVSGSRSTGSLIGSGQATTSANYFATDTSGRASANNGTGALLSELRCPTSADDTACAEDDLFVGWADSVDDQGNPYWVFGEDNQLPGLSINGVVHHDSDGDGAIDAEDDFPFIFAASRDSDGDGAVDYWHPLCDTPCQEASGLTLDQFPHDPAASIDLDLDGMPDEWNEGCDTACQEASGLTLDPYPGDVDNDGVPDDEDDYTDGVLNADIGSNGLIAISTLEQLHAMRYNLAGTGRKMSPDAERDSSGCPFRVYEGVLQRACWGYELAADLDFDTNGDGVLDENDTYWNDGEGWEPIGSYSEPFTLTFDGNGHVIRNLMINRPSSSYQGLFARTEGAEIRNLGLAGRLMSVQGGSYVGALAGRVVEGAITASYATGSVESHAGSLNVYTGGFVGYLDGSAITASYTTGSVSAKGGHVGGLVGYSDLGTFDTVFSTASVVGDSEVGGLIGYSRNSSIERAYATGFVSGARSISTGILIGLGQATTSANYFATDTGSRTSSSDGTGALLSELRCPTSADDTACAEDDLFVGWADSVDDQGNPYWVFGEDNQLPGLSINGVVHHDSDGDGAIDAEDDFPFIFAASRDSDGDGAVDYWHPLCDTPCQEASGLTLDQFPHNPAASIDLDLDGMPDEWNEGCDTACQEASGLTLDPYPNDADNDGVPDAEDDYTDGVPNADVGSNGLITISTLEQLHAMRYNLAGTGRKMSPDAERDSSGCPFRVYEGVLQRACRGYELAADLDFDTNGDGVLDENDTYWNEGEGWEPIGTNSEPFTGIFDGNGYVIRNLVINRPSSNYQGLFARTEGAEVRNLGLTGRLMSVQGSLYVGALAGRFHNGTITGSYATGSVKTHSTSTSTSSAYAGGLVGSLRNSAITASYTAGFVSAHNWYAGGLVGGSYSSSIEDTFSTASVTGQRYVGGLVGHQGGSSSIQSSYATGFVSGTGSVGSLLGGPWGSTSANYFATDTSDQGSAQGGTGALLSELRCPTAADDTACADSALFVGWADAVDGQGSPYWDFGAGVQLPGLRIKGALYRDTDGDGLMDSDDPDIDGDGVPNDEDAFPYNYAASLDSDGDGYPDAWNEGCDAACQAASGLRLDDFPHNAAASLDSDGDGYPDAWNEGCDATCQAASGLRLDDFPGNPAASLDSSGDGYPDAWNDGCDAACQDASGLRLDAFPNSAAASLDSDGDGYPDEWNPGCDRACQEASGLRLDQFPHNPAASLDLDLDGLPDEWNEGCDTACQEASGLTLDLYPGDVDNDGIPDAEDDYTDGVLNADIGSNGLITISTLEQLHAVRYNLAGTGRQMSPEDEPDSTGCPVRTIDGSLQRACWGYELAADLDFDTNGDGVLDENDTYWNDGEGWQPLGSESEPFTGVFDGNGHVIRNLMINRPSSDHQGLFGYTEEASIRNLGLTGQLTAVTGLNHVGGLVGYGLDTAVELSFAVGSVAAHGEHSGGLIGSLDGSGSGLAKAFSVARVLGESYVGGAIGSANDAVIDMTYATGRVEGSRNAGGLAGSADAVGNSYWATDTTGQTSSSGGGEGVTLTEMQCPEAANDIECANTTLYVDWDAATDGDANSYWDFGTETQSPALVLGGTPYRDSDGDGVLDADDAFPNNPAASVDSDGDGYPDAWNDGCDADCQAASGLRLDDFPYNAAASLDSDGDGYPDAWNEGCDATCQAASGLRLDDFPDNPAASLDSDGDGYPDAWNDGCDATCQAESGLRLDDFPDNPAASLDSNGDGQPNEWNQGCDLACQEASGLTLSPDTQSPVIVAVPQDVHQAATGDTTWVTLLMEDLIAYDNRDTELEFEVSLAGETLSLDENDRVSLPSGALELGWVAIDSAGNRSETVVQHVNVYPVVRFSESEMITGEPSQPHLAVSLSGPSPVYPIEITFNWIEQESTATVDDVDSDPETGVDLHDLSIVIESEDDLAEAGLVIPVIDDGIFENDEWLVIEIASAEAGEDDPFAMPVDEDRNRFDLTITDYNVAPEVSLSISQDGEDTSIVDPEGGEVTVVATVTDPNGNDQHSFEWMASDLPVILRDQESFTFDPVGMAEAEYTISVVVTDDGNPPLSSDRVSYEFEVKLVDDDGSDSTSDSDSDSEEGSDSGSSERPDNADNGSGDGSSGAPNNSGGGGSGGNINGLMLLLLLLYGVGIRLRRRAN